MNKILRYLPIFLLNTVNAQFAIKLVVTDVASRKGEDIFVMGNFNNWNPSDPLYKLKPFAGTRRGIVLKNMTAGTYAFKFTRGNSEKIECAADGRDISERILVINDDFSKEYIVEGWKDDYPEKPKPSTTTQQVHIIDTAFLIPQLNTKRRIWIYLPKGYTSVTKSYPVLYMQDGQNLFNEQTASSGEWGIDECLDSLQNQTQKEVIIVGVDNGGDKRIQEYSPFNFTNPSDKKLILGKGKEYADFLVSNLKPYIDSKYRTKKDVENTFIAGSDFGGVISLFVFLNYPKVFGSVGVFSPELWSSPELYKEASKCNDKTFHKMYWYVGEQESEVMLPDLKRMINSFPKNNFIMHLEQSPSGKHDVNSWRKVFPHFYKWLLN